MRVRIPSRAFVAWADKGVLPFAGGVLDQPYPLWRIVEEMYAGYSEEKNARARAAQQAANDRAARGR